MVINLLLLPQWPRQVAYFFRLKLVYEYRETAAQRDNQNLFLSSRPSGNLSARLTSSPNVVTSGTTNTSGSTVSAIEKDAEAPSNSNLVGKDRITWNQIKQELVGLGTLAARLRTMQTMAPD